MFCLFNITLSKEELRNLLILKFKNQENLFISCITPRLTSCEGTNLHNWSVLKEFATSKFKTINDEHFLVSLTSHNVHYYIVCSQMKEVIKWMHTQQIRYQSKFYKLLGISHPINSIRGIMSP